MRDLMFSICLSLVRVISSFGFDAYWTPIAIWPMGHIMLIDLPLRWKLWTFEEFHVDSFFRALVFFFTPLLNYLVINVLLFSFLLLYRLFIVGNV